MTKKLQIAFLFIVPVLFLIIGLQFDRTKYGTDPESAYLMNGLNISMGKAVGHFDNPGTTVQMYSAVVISITHFLSFSEDDLQTDVLLNSEYYIEVLRYSLIVFNALILLLLGLFSFLIARNFWVGFLLQLAPLLSVTLIEECYTKVAPEPLLFAATAVLIVLLLKFNFSADTGKVKYPLIFGLLAGFGVATKMTFLPVLIIPFIILNGKRNKLIYIVSIVPSFVLFTLPAITGYLHMANWFLNLGTHTGTYGQGNPGVIDASVYFKSLIQIAVNNKALIITMLFALLALIFTRFLLRKQEKPQKDFYILMALVIAQAGSILMVAKHYHSNHYLFPALSLTGLVLVFVYFLLSSHFQEKGGKLLKFILPVFALAIIGFSLLNIPFMAKAYQGYRDSNQSTDETFARLRRDYKGFVKVYYYPVSFNEFSSLKWGNTYSRQYSTDKLMELFPDGLFYNVWEKSFQLWETNIPTREFVKKYGTRILLVGGPRTYEEYKAVEQSGLKLKRLFDSRVQAVFEIDTEKSELFKKVIHNQPPTVELTNDFEAFSADGQWIMSASGDKFCRNSGLSTDKARSGKHAFKLDATDTYGMDFELQDVNPGDFIEVSIWRSGGREKAFLAASGGNADPYYQQSSAHIETDNNGWDKVTLDIEIPENFKGSKLKIYLWNHGNTVVWFDDFSISKY